MFVCGQEFSPQMVQRIQAACDAEPDLSRLRLSRQVCEWLEWRRPNGFLKDMSCRVALLKMHRRGVIRLPAVVEGRNPRRHTEHKEPETVDNPMGICCSLSEAGEIELIRIDGPDNRNARTWTTLMNRYHYLGAGPLCGSQMRYLVHSRTCGLLGAVAFSAAAWRLASRDLWVGWDDDSRRKNLHKVVCNSRFLILPQVRVMHLASHVLSLCARQIGADWRMRYGFEPLMVETFVERDRFRGTSYRAANWVHLGSTQGRGRQDRKNRGGVSIKDVYVLPLRAKAREILCEGKMQKEMKRERKIEAEDWAEEEFGGAELGDDRLRKRLLSVARDLYARPQANIPQACQSRAKAKAAYRFFEHTDVAIEKILAPHYESTLSRIKREKTVLAVQDTTSLNYSTHPCAVGLGLIGSKQENIVGLLVHDTMAFNLEGTPLGLMDVQCWARDPKDFGKKHRRHDLPIEEKESNKWLRSFRRAAEACKRCPGTMIVSMGDREADIYELFELALSDPDGPKLLVRAKHDRLLTDDQGHLWDKVAHGPLEGVQEIRVPRRGNRSARVARMEVRFAEVLLKPPQSKPQLGELRVWAVHAEEVDVPDGVEALKWMLLTTLTVGTFDDAAEKLAWYAGRWGIEVYHRTLKSGCKIEQRQLGSADRIEACLAIDMVVAWRIFHLTKLGRETPDVSCTVFFEDAEWKALYSYRTQKPDLPEKIPTLREAIRMVAGLGGFLGRKGDGEPGTQTLWLGLQRLDDITGMWKYMATRYAPQLLKPIVSRGPTYG